VRLQPLPERLWRRRNHPGRSLTLPFEGAGDRQNRRDQSGAGRRGRVLAPEPLFGPPRPSRLDGGAGLWFHRTGAQNTALQPDLQTLSPSVIRTDSAGEGKTRTTWDIVLTVGMPFSRWGAVPFVVNPIPFPSVAATNHLVTLTSVKELPPIHPFHLALRWRDEMAANPGLTQSRIAARENISRARVTQVMNPLHLPVEVQADLLNPPAPLGIDVFSERSLRALVSCSNEEDQIRQWRTLLEAMRALTPG